MKFMLMRSLFWDAFGKKSKNLKIVWDHTMLLKTGLSPVGTSSPLGVNSFHLHMAHFGHPYTLSTSTYLYYKWPRIFITCSKNWQVSLHIQDHCPKAVANHYMSISHRPRVPKHISIPVDYKLWSCIHVLMSTCQK
jgi:hypothetical protein